MIGFLPPAPQPEVMRAGALGEHGNDPSLAPPPTEQPDDGDAPSTKRPVFSVRIPP